MSSAFYAVRANMLQGVVGCRLIVYLHTDITRLMIKLRIGNIREAQKSPVSHGWCCLWRLVGFRDKNEHRKRRAGRNKNTVNPSVARALNSFATAILTPAKTGRNTTIQTQGGGNLFGQRTGVRNQKEIVPLALPRLIM